MKCDAHGRPYAKLDELKPGDKVQVDDGFDCIPPWSTRMVMANNKGSFILCKEGNHYLKGHCDEGEHCIGIYNMPKGEHR